MSRFGSVKFDEASKDAQKRLNDAYRELEKLIKKVTRPGRSQSKAYGRLEESAMWAIKAVRDRQVDREAEKSDSNCDEQE